MGTTNASEPGPRIEPDIDIVVSVYKKQADDPSRAWRLWPTFDNDDSLNHRALDYRGIAAARRGISWESPELFLRSERQGALLLDRE